MDEVILNANQWVAILVTVSGAFGLFIANLFQAMKAREEAKKTRAEAKKISEGQQQVLDQFKNNGGSSMKDTTDRIESTLTEMSGRLEAQLKIIRGELGFQRREILRLAEVDVQDREIANEVHKDLKKDLRVIKNDLKTHIDDTPNVVSKAQQEVLEILEQRRNDATE